VLVVSGCSHALRPVPVDQLAPGEWRAVLRDERRAAYAAEPLPARVAEAWRAKAGRGLMSAPVVAWPLILLSSENGSLTAISGETGRRFWDRRGNGPVHGPLRQAEHAYFAGEGRAREVRAVRLRDGWNVWKQRVGSASHAPSLVGDTLLVGTDAGEVIALRARDGEVIWRARLGKRIASTPVPFGDAVIVATAVDSLHLLERATGRVRTRVPLGGAASAAPALHGDTLLVPLHTGELVVLALPELRVIRRVALGAPILAAPAIAPDGAIYLLTRQAEVWRLAGGMAEPVRIAALGGTARGALTLARGGLLVGLLDGTLVALDEAGAILWREELGGSIAAPPALADGSIFVPLLHGVLVKLSPET